MSYLMLSLFIVVGLPNDFRSHKACMGSIYGVGNKKIYFWRGHRQSCVIQYFGHIFKKRIDKKVPFTQIGCQRFFQSLTTQNRETAQWNWQKRYSIG